MESKTWVKFAHIIAFLLLATSFETLMAREERAQVSDGLEVIKLLKELKSGDGFDESNLVCNGKQRWPELLGVPAKLAEQIVLKENSSVRSVEIILIGSPVTPDFSCNRVRIFVNVLNIVVAAPIVG